MNIDALRVFVEVAKHNSFSKAAKSLRLSSTAASARVKSIEQELAIRLFDRTTRAVYLTEAGEMIYQKALNIIASMDDIRSIAASQLEEPQGLLRISAMATMGSLFLGDWLIEFQLLYPKIEFEMIYSNNSLDLQDNHLDFGFRQHSLPNSNLIARKLTEHHWGIFSSPEFINRHQAIAHPNDLHQVPCIGVVGENSDTVWRFKKEANEIQFQPKTVLALEDPLIGLKAAVAGIGVAYLVKGLTEAHVKKGELVELLPEWETPQSNLYLIYQSKEHMPAKCRAFIDFILDKFSEPLDLS
ncbi:MAG: LysR family transcriptional regulator [Pseudomonadales bacterium]|nr:LysR family transcriptional regulator [Pseudomonadales bacterium]